MGKAAITTITTGGMEMSGVAITGSPRHPFPFGQSVAANFAFGTESAAWMCASDSRPDVGDIARAERLCRTYVTRELCLVFLAPEITKRIIEGRQPPELTAKKLRSSALKIPLVWDDQCAHFDFRTSDS